MDLEIFKHIDDIVEAFDSKRDIYKLIAEEIQLFFERNVFNQSQYTLNMIYRIKSVDSIREKLVRNSYISKFRDGEAVLANFTDLIGLRIECKFIDDESYVYELIKKLFSNTEDGVYFYEPTMPKIRLKLNEPQPQKQKNGFDIYKIDGIFLLGKERVKFELQIKALVNAFWGEIEHKIIYKNSSYNLADNFVSDLMTSIKKSLNMIDAQLYVLYKRFKRVGDGDYDKNNAYAIEKFISKMVYDVFYQVMSKQIGFAIDFKSSCDAVVRYLMVVNNANDMEDYGQVMLNVFYTLNTMQEEDVRVDRQIEFERTLWYEDKFSHNLYNTITALVNINFKWHMFFLVLFQIERGGNSDDLESFIRYYRNTLLANRTFALLDGREDAMRIRLDVINALSEYIGERQKIELLTLEGIRAMHRAINKTLPAVVEQLDAGVSWEDVRSGYDAALREAIQL